jgi:hypothetical protein
MKAGAHFLRQARARVTALFKSPPPPAATEAKMFCSVARAALEAALHTERLQSATKVKRLTAEIETLRSAVRSLRYTAQAVLEEIAVAKTLDEAKTLLRAALLVTEDVVD